MAGHGFSRPTSAAFSVFSVAPPSYHSVDPVSSRSPSPTETIRTQSTSLERPSQVDLLGSVSQLSLNSGPYSNAALLRPPVAQFGLKYSFSQLDATSMHLSPPPEALDSRSLYHISVHANVFKPLSHITVVHRGGSRTGPYAGEFEYGP